MKKITFWFSVLLFAGIFLMAPGKFEQTHAARGCCKQAAPGGGWYPNGMSFNQCRSSNQSHDADDLFAPSLTFWWDVNC